MSSYMNKETKEKFTAFELIATCIIFLIVSSVAFISVIIDRQKAQLKNVNNLNANITKLKSELFDYKEKLKNIVDANSLLIKKQNKEIIKYKLYINDVKSLILNLDGINNCMECCDNAGKLLQLSDDISRLKDDIVVFGLLE